MENLNDSKPDLLASTGLQVDEETGNHLKDAGQWAKAVAVIASVLSGLIILIMFSFGNVFLSAFGLGLQEYTSAIVVVVIILLTIAIFGIAGLFRFSSGMSAGITHQDTAAFSKGMGGLKNYLILMGVLTLLSVLFDLIDLINIL